MKVTEQELVETLEQLYNACFSSSTFSRYSVDELRIAKMKAKDVIDRATSEPYIETFGDEE